jgi:type III secretion system (T3SS) SseB-like protein
MSFFNKLFRRQSKGNTPDSIPENYRLLFLLNAWVQHSSCENYQAVLKEIEEGNSFLIVGSQNDDAIPTGWHKTRKATTLKLTSLIEKDGLRILGAFTDKRSLLEWIKKPTAPCISMRSQDVLNLCETNKIDRIVINSGQPNMFVLERNLAEQENILIPKGTDLLLGTPAKPLQAAIIEKMIANFKKIETIREAYQYSQVRNKDFSIVIGILLSVDTEYIRTAAIQAVQNALQGAKLIQSIDVLILDADEMYNVVKNIKNSLFYSN